MTICKSKDLNNLLSWW